MIDYLMTNIGIVIDDAFEDVEVVKGCFDVFATHAFSIFYMKINDLTRLFLNSCEKNNVNIIARNPIEASHILVLTDNEQFVRSEIMDLVENSDSNMLSLPVITMVRPREKNSTWKASPKKSKKQAANRF